MSRGPFSAALLLLCAIFVMTVGHTRAEVAPSPSPTARQSLDDAWWTGPILAAGAGTLPRGHILVEPYVYDVITYGRYDRSGTRTGATHANSYGSLTYMLYGLTDRVTVGVLPAFGFNSVSQGSSSSRVGVGDVGVLAQYRLTQYRLGKWTPTTSFVVQETLPTGKYDNLGEHPGDGLGSGAYTTTVSFYAQTYFWMNNGRILRMRVDTSQAFSSGANVDGVSVYGTANTFHGTAKPGNAFYVDVSEEYSLTRSWVLALDTLYRHDHNTRVSAGSSTLDSGASDTFALAPAVEYSWTPNVGVIVGARLIPAGRNTSATLSPVIAINIVH